MNDTDSPRTPPVTRWSLRHEPGERAAPAFPAPAGTGPDDVALWWLGQAGFALRHRDQLVLIDPYLSDTLAEKYRGTLFPHVRMHPAPVAPEDLRGVTAVLCTHGHTDHMDPGTLRALLPHNDPRFVVPRAERTRALERGIPADRLTGTNAGEHLALDGLTIEPVPAAHERLEQDANGDHRFLGYVLTIGGIRVYHSGDCAPYDGQAELLRDLRIDLALLPVNGRDAHRAANGVPGNFTLHEAAELCATAGIPRLLCHHFGLFDFNTLDPDAARDALRRRAAPPSWTVPGVGHTYVLAPAGTTAKGTR